jgi:hypothetical protein
MAGLGIPFLDKNIVPFPPKIPAVGAATAQQAQVNIPTAASALTYIGSNLIYVAAFIMLTLIIFWTLGKKASFYFLLLVLAGQLIFNASTIQALLPIKG